MAGLVPAIHVLLVAVKTWMPATSAGMTSHSDLRTQMLTLADTIDRLNSTIGRAAAWLCLAVVVIQFAVVVLRYVFGMGSIWLQESILYSHAALFLLAAAWTLKNDGHVRVDIFYSTASPRTKAKVDLVGALLLLIPFASAILYFSWPYVARSWSILESSREASGLPFVFLLKTLIPVFAAMLILQGIAQAIRASSVISGNIPGKT
jgi:TRAP-type mannitol/chloroaromatic compound transport system permease small subunit